MTYSKSVTLEKTVIILAGKIDSSAASEMEVFADDALIVIPQRLVFDLAEVSYISSKGLSVLIKSKKRIGSNPCVLLNANRVIVDLINMSGIESFFVFE